MIPENLKPVGVTLNVERLVHAGILREVPTAGRRRMFLAEGILAAVEGR